MFTIKRKDEKNITKDKLLSNKKLLNHFNFLFKSSNPNNISFTEYVNNNLKDGEKYKQLNINNIDIQQKNFFNISFNELNYDTGEITEDIRATQKINLQLMKFENDEYGNPKTLLAKLNKMTNNSSYLTLKELFQTENNDIKETLFYKMLLLANNPLTSSQVDTSLLPPLKTLVSKVIESNEESFNFNKFFNKDIFNKGNLFSYNGLTLSSLSRTFLISPSYNTHYLVSDEIIGNERVITLKCPTLTINNRHVYYTTLDNPMVLEMRINNNFNKHLSLQDLLIAIHNDVILESDLLNFIHNEYLINNNESYLNKQSLTLQQNGTINYGNDDKIKLNFVDGSITITKNNSIAYQSLIVSDTNPLDAMLTKVKNIDTITMLSRGFCFDITLEPFSNRHYYSYYKNYDVTAIDLVDNVFSRTNNDYLLLQSASFTGFRRTKFFKNYYDMNTTKITIPIEQL